MKYFYCYFIVLIALGCATRNSKMLLISNPILAGYFADPSIIKDKGVFYIYATIDPWGGNELAVLATKDFKSFEQKHLNWPSKEQCTSPTSGGAMVWAPSIVKADNGNFYMYVSVGSELWAGVAKSPLGPWNNAKNDNSPLIKGNLIEGFHMIDAECFIDNDGQMYLYWGSGLNWINGKCFVVKLKNDGFTFDGIPRDITPPHYFEAPFMLRKKNTYYLMYSEGKAIDSTYKIRYSIGKTPFGPWAEGKNSPILSSSKDGKVSGPGHHTIFNVNGQEYILYHKLFPQKEDFVLRQLCIDSLNFDESGHIKKIMPMGVSEF